MGQTVKFSLTQHQFFLLKKVDPFSQKLFLKIFEHHKSHFFKNTKGSRFGLLRFGSVLKSKHRFGRFEVRFPEVREVRGSVISGSFQVYQIPWFQKTLCFMWLLYPNVLSALSQDIFFFSPQDLLSQITKVVVTQHTIR